LIKAAPQVIWDVLADFGALSSWVDGVDHSAVLNDGPGGTLLGTTRRVQMGRNVLIERVTDARPTVELGYDITGLPRRLRHVANRWTLQPASAGTVVTITSTVDIGGNPMALIAERIVCRVMARQSDSMLAGMAKRTENAHG
jgi:carbon monoxide dehydrogenase subunit G